MNILIIGNGFDRKLGMKTDYISFLEWMREEGYGVGRRFNGYSMDVDFRSVPSYYPSRLQVFKNYMDSSMDLVGEKFEFRNFSSVNNFDESTENDLAGKLQYLLPEITGSKSKNFPKNEKANIWYTFIQLLRFQKEHGILNIDISKFSEYLNPDGNWVDVEGLIQKSIELRVEKDYYKNGVFSISNHFDVFSLANYLSLDIKERHQMKKEEIYEIVWNDFIEFKQTLTDYLSFLSFGITNQEEHFIKESDKYRISTDKTAFTFNNISQYSKIISFNYVPLVLNHRDLYHVHGNINDKGKIVFGFDVNLKNSDLHKEQRKTVFEINLSKNKSLLKFSKLHQLLHLQVDKEQNNIGKVGSMTIVGHSIGEQDYSYYFSILDRNIDNIEIICLWYEFNEGGDNNESLKEALLEMLFNYEKYSNQRILHKMIFEGRIKFRKIFIPQIIS